MTSLAADAAYKARFDCTTCDVSVMMASCCYGQLINNSLYGCYAPRPEILGDCSCTSGEGYFRRQRLQLIITDYYRLTLIRRLALGGGADGYVR